MPQFIDFPNGQPIGIGSYNSILAFELRDKSLTDNTLRFNPVQIGEWLHGLLTRHVVWTHAALAEYVGMSRTRVGQFLSLAGLPVETRAKLRGMPNLNECQIRGMMAGPNRKNARMSE
jgi:hypothetical protein